MFRDALSMLVIFALTLFTVNPAANAQFTPASAGSQSAYPAPADPGPYAQAAPYPANPQSGYPGYPAPNSYPQNGVYPPPGQAGYGAPQNQAGNEQDVAADQQHGVARLSVVQGDVNVKRGDTGQLTAAVMNAPLMAQDRVQTSPGSRAEVELDYANLIRVGPDTDLGFADLEYRRDQLQLGAGTIIYRVLRASQAQVEIDTPSIALRPVDLCDLRISVLEDGTTRISVRSGSAEIFSPRGSETIAAGRAVLVRGNAGDPEFQETSEIARDQFDDWSAHRDQDLAASQSYRYVSSDVGGADDLDAYGNWVPSQYGQVWAPQNPGADWSPYSDGQWSYEPYYGWTWVDAAPWGWAPYHYGRWFWNGGHGWCWWPGALRASYAWNPALVGFFGWGGFGIGLALGGLGWVALAPFEIFHPWWGRGGFGRGWYGNGFARSVDVGRLYRNAAIRGGAMTAGYNSFGGPNRRFSAANRGQLSSANLFRGQVPIGPSRASYQFSNRAVSANPRLASASGRQFFEHQQFGATRSGFSQPGASRSFNGGPGQAGPAQHGVAPNVQSRSGADSFGGPRESSGWQRFGDPGSVNGSRQSFSGSEASGWHRFGEPQANGLGAHNGTLAQPRSNSATSRPYSGGSFSNSYQGRPSGSPQTGGFGQPRNTAPSYGSFGRGNSFSAPSSHYNSPQQSFSAPRFSSPAPQSHYSAPHYSAPSSHSSAPHESAPSSHSSGGGGGHSSSGGSSHGGGGGHHR